MSAFHKKTFFSAVVLLFAVCRAVQAGRVFDVREFGAAGDLHRCVKKADRISFTSCKLIDKRRK